MKMMHGACDFPCSNRSRTRDAPTPTNISTKSEPDMEKNGRPASPATALASSVLPVPGGPINSAPLEAVHPGAEISAVLEEIDDLLELLLGFVTPRHVGERDLRRIARQELCLGLPERKRAVATLLHLPQHEDDQPEDEQVWQEAEQEDAERLLFFARADVLGPFCRRVATHTSLDSNGSSVVKFSVVRCAIVTGVLNSPRSCCRSVISTVEMFPASSCSVNWEYDTSAASCRRLDANCTSAIDPAISSAQNDSVRSVRPQLKSRLRFGTPIGHYVRLAI